MYNYPPSQVGREQQKLKKAEYKSEDWKKQKQQTDQVVCSNQIIKYKSCQSKTSR